MTAELHPADRTDRPVFSRGFSTWLSASTLAATGDGICYFAIGWTATALGGGVAGMIMTLVVLPRTVLLLVGGAAADRWGLRRTMIGCDLFMCVVLTVYLGASRTDAPAATLLAALAFALGVASAFRIPAAGAFPRLFVDGEALPRAMAVTSSALQVARMTGPPLGGAVVAALGMTGAISANLAGFVVILVVLLWVRPPLEGSPESGPRESTLRSIIQGVTAARTLPGIPLLLATIGIVAAGVIPMLSLLVPLAAHERGWVARETGLVESAWIVGTLAITVLVARFGTYPKAITPLAVGPLLTAIGIVSVAYSDRLPAALLGAFTMGIGTALFTTHAIPLYILRSPEGMLARFQALAGVVQSAPMLVSNNVLGALGSDGHATRAMLVVAAVTLAATPALLASRALRTARLST